MKITQEHQNTLENLLESQVQTYGYKDLRSYVQSFKKSIEEGRIKPLKCVASRCFGNILTSKPLFFVCDEIYKYADDSHLKTFWKRLYDKY